ncbi:kinase-like domain-containing protein [Lineolata rhizophorae]|uniref:mitogen-activated protein kinase n=1 Tax=Lineolata rhizophorae TaxID=578093 RepID=A0A6A6P0J7_9PEZI|nr:kinase-like domain-containing protein [Lineolata rhizophorae]
MAGNVNARTLFHLVPVNQATHNALLHPDNNHFVSTSAKGPGLEIGFHVPSMSRGRVMTRLGRDADLILPGRDVSAVHVAFEIHPETHVVLLSVRSKRSSTVTVSNEGTPGAQQISEDCVLVYGICYKIRVTSYMFNLLWRDAKTVESLRELAVEGYRDSLLRLQNVRSRDRPTEFTDSELHSWHNTRLHTARKVLFREAEGAPRVLIGAGAFGAVYRAVDFESGNPFAVKVVRLDTLPDTKVEHARAALHREIKALEQLKHENIVECLGVAKFDTNNPEIFMPLRRGNLSLLIKNRERQCSEDKLCSQVLEQMLCALDYLADRGLCHRDVKPENILYWQNTAPEIYSFQLADFGLVNHQQNATTFCGTGFYQAPELYDVDRFPQSPKMDVWSLFATIIDVHSKFTFPPRDARNYYDVLQAARAAVLLAPELADMAREDPAHRASAAQLLVAHFNGRGLTTRRAAVLPIWAPPSAECEQTVLGGGDPSSSGAAPTPVPAPQAPWAAKASPLIVYDARHRRRRSKELASPANTPPPTWARRDGGIVKTRAPSSKPAIRHRVEEQLDKELSRGQANKELEKGQPEREFRIPGSFLE